MEPRALMSANSTPFKDKSISYLDKTERALSELSLNKGTSTLSASNSRSRFHDAVTERQFTSCET
jgi:hypothetical protein